MGLGLGWSNANSDMAGELRQRIIDQLAQQQAMQSMALQARSADRADRQQGLAEQEHAAALAETARQHDLNAANQVEDNNRALNEQIPAGTFFEDAPAQQKIVGRLQSVGGATMEPNQQERPKVDVGPLLPGDDGGEKKRGYLKLASSKQQTAQEAADAKVEAARLAAENHANDNEQKNLDRLAQIKAAAAGRPPAAELGWTIQQGMVGGKPGWVRINSRTGDVQPVAPGDITPKPSAQETEHTRTNAEAHDTLNQLDQAITDAKDLIGPGMGRISSLEQMAGSADPRIQALGVKMKAAKMRVDHAVTGSVRAGASPQMMQRWDNILANKVTPEGLKAGVQAMREILGGGAAPAGGGGGRISVTAPDGSVHPFDTQAQADAFKQLAGIK